MIGLIDAMRLTKPINRGSIAKTVAHEGITRISGLACDISALSRFACGKEKEACSRYRLDAER